MKRFAGWLIKSLLIGIGVVCVCGLHLPILQGVAWVKMYAELSEVVPQEIALEILIEGKEVCGLCEAVNDAQQKGSTHYIDTVTTLSKLIPKSLVKIAPERTLKAPYVIDLIEPNTLIPRIPTRPPTPPPQLV